MFKLISWKNDPLGRETWQKVGEIVKAQDTLPVALIRTASGLNCGLNSLERVNLKVLQNHLPEFFGFLRTLGVAADGSTPLFPLKTFLYSNNPEVMESLASNFIKHPWVQTIHTYPSRSQNNMISLYLINVP